MVSGRRFAFCKGDALLDQALRQIEKWVENQGVLTMRAVAR